MDSGMPIKEFGIPLRRWESEILSLNSEIYSVESRIQDCVGLACVARVSDLVNAQKLEGVFCYHFILAQWIEWIFRIA